MQIFFNSFFKIFGAFVAILLFFLILILISDFSSNQKESIKFELISGDSKSENIVLVINLNGLIINEEYNLAGLTYQNIITPKKIQKYLTTINSFNPKIIIIKLNSPGGTVSASNEIYNIIDEYKNINQIPILFYTNETLTSGAYWVAQSGNKIYASYGSLVGSIGVMGPDWIYYNKPTSISEGILGRSVETKDGIEIYSQVAGKSKDLLNPFRKPTSNELQHLNKIIQNVYLDFINIVSKNRKIEKNILINDIGALIFDSKSAKENFLIDDVLEFNKLVDNIIKINNFESYQLIENEEEKFSLFAKYFSIFNKNLVTNSSLYNSNYLCNKIKISISSIIYNFFENC